MSSAADPKDKIDALVDLVDEGYGKILIEQLLSRLDMTAKDFIREIDELVNNLKRNAAAQEELLDRIRQREEEQARTQPVDEPPETEVTEWEKRLARLEESAE